MSARRAQVSYLAVQPPSTEIEVPVTELGVPVAARLTASASGEQTAVGDLLGCCRPSHWRELPAESLVLTRLEDWRCVICSSSKKKSHDHLYGPHRHSAVLQALLSRCCARSEFV